MRFDVRTKLLGACCFVSALCAQQFPPVYPVNAGQMQQPSPNPSGQPEGQPSGEQDFLPNLYIKNGDIFEQQTLSQNDLMKAIVIFYSVACPHCDTLLATLAPHVSKLKDIKIIFVNVPGGDDLQRRRPPTPEGYNQAVAKVTAHGIAIDGNHTQVVVVADVATLSRYGITGLPVMMVIKKSREQFRGIGQDAIQKVNFGDTATLSQLQAVFKDVSEDAEDADEKQKGAKAGGKSSGKGKHAANDIVVSRGVNRDLAQEWTAILNSECGQALPGTTSVSPQQGQKREVPAPATKLKKRKCICNVS